MSICKTTAQLAAVHSGALFEGATQLRFLQFVVLRICPDQGHSAERVLAPRRMPVRLLPMGTAWNPCLTLMLFLCLPMVSMDETHGGSGPSLSETQIFLSCYYSDSTTLLLENQHPFACAKFEQLDEGSVGSSRG